MIFAHITPTSANAKTGPILVTTTSAKTCPPSCPFRKRAEIGAGRGRKKARLVTFGCYADGGPLAIHWGAVTAGERGAPWPRFLLDLGDALKRKGRGALWRHNQAGDLPGERGEIDRQALADLVAVNAAAEARGFTYSHYPLTLADAGGADLARTAEEDAAVVASNRAAMAIATAQGFTVNASANGLGHADAIADALEGWKVPITAVVAADAPDRGTTPGGRRYVVCPAQTREGVNCATCRLCSRAERSVIVAFRVHGSGAKRAAAAIANSDAVEALGS